MRTNEDLLQAGSVNGAPLRWLRAEGVAVFILSILLYRYSGASWWSFWLLLLAPDVVMAGYWASARVGAVCYNLGHSYVGPFVLAAGALVADMHQLLPYTLIWIAHIGMDRALGYGLKYPEAFQRTHLGWLGRGAVKQ